MGHRHFDCDRAVQDKHQDAFARLNKAWPTEHGLFEEADRAHLEQPRKSILSGGGQIFVALDKARPRRVRDHRAGRGHHRVREVRGPPEARGRGIGRHLTAAALASAPIAAPAR